MHDLREQATFPTKQRVEKLGSSAEPIKLQRLLATLSQHSPVGCGPFHTKRTFEKAQMRSLKGAVRCTALLHAPCSPDLASIHTYACTRVHTHTHTHIRVHTHTHAHTHTYPHLHTKRTRACTYTHAYIVITRTCTRMHAHTSVI